MKAAVYDRYGGPEVVTVREVPKPVPKNDEMLIRVHASPVTYGDHRGRSLEMPAGLGLVGRMVFGLSRPRHPILGGSFAGVVEDIGRDVTKFKVGDAVFGSSGSGMGCHAEYVTVSENAPIALKPANISFETASALQFGGETVLHFFAKGKIAAGESVLINGASGCVGSAMVEFARRAGATVTGVCSGANADAVRALGAEHVIDYTREDFTRNGLAYDVIADCVGNVSYARAERSLKDGGRLLLVICGLGAMVGAGLRPRRGTRTVYAGGFTETAEHMQTLAQLAATGEFNPLIERTFNLHEVVEAHRRVASNRKRGSVVLKLV